mmetsp:Transcript_46816/g.134879  ORF Transcript_46816/g.134879 Transcript_46816/m.134879 type:complete len:255 (-) Transcript_46816:1025-1789(-)
MKVVHHHQLLQPARRRLRLHKDAQEAGRIDMPEGRQAKAKDVNDVDILQLHHPKQGPQLPVVLVLYDGHPWRAVMRWAWPANMPMAGGRAGAEGGLRRERVVADVTQDPLVSSNACGPNVHDVAWFHTFVHDLHEGRKPPRGRGRSVVEVVAVRRLMRALHSVDPKSHRRCAEGSEDVLFEVVRARDLAEDLLREGDQTMQAVLLSVLHDVLDDNTGDNVHQHQQGKCDAQAEQEDILLPRKDEDHLAPIDAPT